MLIQSANLALRFLLELAALGALAYWGSQTGRVPITKVGLGVGAPLLAALVWGTFGSPSAPVTLSGPLHLLLELAVFGSGAEVVIHGDLVEAEPFDLTVDGDQSS